MRTKTLLCAAALAAGVVTSMAQSNVYSLNVVGYYNITVPPHNGNGSQPLNAHSAMIANQLNTTNNTLKSLIPNPPVNSVFNKYVTGSGFQAYQFDEFDLVWYPDGNVTLNPGEGGLFVNAIQQTSPLTLTFVGEVLQGPTTNSMPNGYSVRSLNTPQQWSPGNASFNFPAVPNDVINKFVTGSGFQAYQFDEFDLVWYPSDPVINVGESILIIKVGAANWTRNFTVQ